MNKEETYEIRAGWLSNEKIGDLFVGSGNRQDILAFAYDDNWLDQHSKLVLDLNLYPFSGRQFCNNGLFSFLQDASPDRWGRTLLKYKEQDNAKKESRNPKELTDVDYLLGVSDQVRIGGIRIFHNGEYVSQSTVTIPPITSLRALQDVSIQFEKAGTILQVTELAPLVTGGSSLGGARPKVTVVDEEEHLWIAKFESDRDKNTTEAWEFVAHELGKQCGLTMAEGEIEFLGGRTAYLTKRFDRVGKKRVHFASAMTMLNKQDGDDASFLDIAECISTISANPKADLLELWKRIAFSIAVNNTDCHLRNHGFILTENGWRLSPAYDITPNPFDSYMALSINESNKSPDYQLLIDTAPYYGVETPKEMIEDIRIVVADNYKKWAGLAKIPRREITKMSRIFERRLS